MRKQYPENSVKGSKMNAKEIVERIMTSHYDLAACNCWICKEGRKAKYHARTIYPLHPQTVLPAEKK